jgi:hypothetical protein
MAPRPSLALGIDGAQRAVAQPGLEDEAGLSTSPTEARSAFQSRSKQR